MPIQAPWPGQTPGSRQPRFPGFDVVGQADKWDPVTAGVVLSRLGPPPPIRFFTPGEEAIARRLLDLLLDQRDDPKVPVVEMVDARLAEHVTDGWHYENMPEDSYAWRKSLAGLDADAVSRHQCAFVRCNEHEQMAIIQAVQDSGSDSWHGLPADRIWSLWTRYACTAFYAHPWAWNEMGFSGPAYPRGYKDTGVDRIEPWEVRDRRGTDPVRGD
jgi:hypothetical protein